MAVCTIEIPAREVSAYGFDQIDIVALVKSSVEVVKQSLLCAESQSATSISRPAIGDQDSAPRRISVSSSSDAGLGVVACRDVHAECESAVVIPRH